MSESDGAHAPDRAKTSSVRTFLRDLLVILLVAFLLSFLLKTFLVRSFYIPSGSMRETLQVNDRILVNQLVPDVVPVQRGDIVVFKDPGGWLYPTSNTPPNGVEKLLQTLGLAADTSHEYVVKRVIGVGGDRVTCCDAEGQMTVNGVPLSEPYTVIPDDKNDRASLDDFDVNVPAHSVWVMGDNRYASKDSRYNQDQPGKGFVPESEIVGRAFFLNWPLNRFHWLGRANATFDPVGKADKTSGAQPHTQDADHTSVTDE